MICAGNNLFLRKIISIILVAGHYYTLKVNRISDYGLYLADEDGNEVLLPNRYVSVDYKPGISLEVFIYHDSEDRLVATTERPLATVGQTACLKVVDKTVHGAFLDWGLEKDLFLPFKQQTRRLHPGDEVLVSLYIDKSDRLCATMKVYHFLKTNSPYVVGDTVKGRIYEISGNFGVFVAVDDRYSGLIPKREAQADYHVGQELECRVTEVKEDGKLSLSARGKAYEQIAIDAESVLSVIEEFAGVLPFDDKASPEVIQREFGLSKAAFKRAVGHLMKEKQVVIRDGKIWTAEKAK